MATQSAKAAGGSSVNDGATVLKGGNIDSTNTVSNALSIRDTAGAGISQGYGAKMVTVAGDVSTWTGSTGRPGGEWGDNTGITTAYAGGTGGFAYYPDPVNRTLAAPGFLIRTVSSQVNKTDNSILKINGSDHAIENDNIHERLNYRRLGTGESFDLLAQPGSGIIPGRPNADRGTNRGDALNFVDGTTAGGTTAATDNAATPTRAIPGELTYHFGGLGKATTDEYKARDAFEPADDTSS